MAEPVETIIICVQQDFEVGGGFNLVHIKIGDDRMPKKSKKHKNAAFIN